MEKLKEMLSPKKIDEAEKIENGIRSSTEYIC